MFLRLLSNFKLTAGKLIPPNIVIAIMIALSLFTFFLLWFCSSSLWFSSIPDAFFLSYMQKTWHLVSKDQVYASQSKSKVWEPQGWFGGPKYRFFKAIGSKVTKVFCRYACFLLFAICLFTSFLYCNWSLKRKVATIAKQKRINETY